jgi:hypothetical protein
LDYTKLIDHRSYKTIFFDVLINTTYDVVLLSSRTFLENTEQKLDQ